MTLCTLFFFFFFFNDTATTEIYTLSLHDALPISFHYSDVWSFCLARRRNGPASKPASRLGRSEEHTSELQSRSDLVCRLLLEKKKKRKKKKKQLPTKQTNRSKPNSVCRTYLYAEH